MRIRLGGAFHSAVELKEREYAFGGHFDSLKGIYDCKAMWRQREEELKKIEELGLAKKEAKAEKKARLKFLPALKERRVLGVWSGTTKEWERLLDRLHEKEWKGPQYRLLTKNCNNFVAAVFTDLQKSPHFAPAPGLTEKDLRYLFHLPDNTWRLCCCMPMLPRALDEPLPPAPFQSDIFHGRARRLDERAVNHCLVGGLFNLDIASSSALQDSEVQSPRTSIRNHGSSHELGNSFSESDRDNNPTSKMWHDRTAAKSNMLHVPTLA